MNIYSPSGLFGERIAAVLGLPGHPRYRLETVGDYPFAATELRTEAASARPVQLPTERAYLLSIDLDSAASSIYDLREPNEISVARGGHIVQLYIACEAFEHCATRAGNGRGRPDIRRDETCPDVVLADLARCLLPLLDGSRINRPVFENLALAIYSHLRTSYFVEPGFEPVRGGLAPWQQKRARQLRGDNLTKPMTISEVADTCSLSVSHFGRAFRQTEGVSPHQWLIRRRVDHAKPLLENGELSLAEIAIECGFADQSHFTRAFSSHVGMPPGLWRRRFRIG